MQEILYPVGRYVGGSIYKAYKKTNRDGTPKLDKSGQQQISFSFGVAFAKAGTTHWAQTEWGAKIWQEGHAGFPNGEAQRPDFAWKVTDGDSMIPNKKGNKPAENEGWAGHWVVWFSGTYAPKTCSANGAIEYTDAVERIKPGHFVQVFGSVKDNKPSESPGVYVNYGMTAHAGFGPEIAIGMSVDSTKVGFGGAPLPAGASAAPLGATALPGAPAVPTAVPGAPAVPMAAPAMPSSAPVAVITPNPAFLNPPASAPAVPVATPPAVAHAPAIPVAPARGMTAKAAGHSYEAMRSAGWTDEQLIAQGYMTA